MRINTEINHMAIPDRLRNDGRRQWVLWGSRREKGVDRVDKEGKLVKIPFSVDKSAASTTDPLTWGSYKEVVDMHAGGWFNGIGYVLHQDDVVCIDLDHCITTGPFGVEIVIADYAVDIMQAFSGIGPDPKVYVEYSPSGDGLHIWCLGHPQNLGSRFVEQIEVYGTDVRGKSSPRFMTVTGQVASGSFWTPGVVTYQNDALAWLDEVYGLPENAALPSSTEDKAADDVWREDLRRESLPPSSTSGASFEEAEAKMEQSIGNKSNYVTSIIDGDSRILASCRKGQRNTRLFAIACNWKRLSNAAWANVLWSDLREILRTVAVGTGLSNEESIKTILQAGMRAGAEERKPPVDNR